MVLNEATLNDCLVFIDRVGDDLPTHIRRFKNQIVTFNNEVTKTYLASPEDELAEAEEDAKEADYIGARDTNEAKWVDYYVERFLTPFERISRITKNDTRRYTYIPYSQTASSKFLHGHFTTARDKPWTLFNPRGNFEVHQRQGLTTPKPDWIAAFPAYNDDYISKLNIPKGWCLKEHAGSDTFVHFSDTTFWLLSQMGMFAHIQTFPKTLPRRAKKKTDYHCFPWFIVEFKKANKAEEFCYCQAANAGSAAILIFEKLCQWDLADDNFSQIPPVLTMTAIGSEVKLWVVYATKGRIKMSAIWGGDVKVARDVLKLKVILENIHTWLIHDLKPALSSNIKRWLIVHQRKVEQGKILQSEYRSGRTPVSDNNANSTTKEEHNAEPTTITVAPVVVEDKGREDEFEDEERGEEQQAEEQGKNTKKNEVGREEDSEEATTPINNKTSISRAASPSYTGKTLVGSAEKPNDEFAKEKSASRPDLVKPVRVFGSSSAFQSKIDRLVKRLPYNRKNFWNSDDLEDEGDGGVDSDKPPTFKMVDVRAALAELTSSVAEVGARNKALKASAVEEESSDNENDSSTPESPSVRQQMRRRNAIMRTTV